MSESLQKLRHYDTLVVGSGLSGLTAAITSAESGKRTAILTKGAGTLSIGGGVIDLLGYVDGMAVKDPEKALIQLPETHPYRIVGPDKVMEAIQYFERLTASMGFAYKNCGGLNCVIPTAIGTVKPTYLVPQTSDPELLHEADPIVVMGIKGLKDFYPELMIDGLKKRRSYREKDLHPLIIESPHPQGRDLNALDVARYMDTEEGFEWLVNSLRAYKGSTIIMPPVLGTKPSTERHDMLNAVLEIKAFETPVMPPSVPGLRLRQLLMAKAKMLNVEMIEMAHVQGAYITNGCCNAVYTLAGDQERQYTADKYIIATGGFFGGGCLAEPGKAIEPVLGIDLNAPANQMDWSGYSLLGDKHPFASMGVRVDEKLRPLSSYDGTLLHENVRIAGRTLGGYDFVTEKSGNGVAIVSGYLAGRE